MRADAMLEAGCLDRHVHVLECKERTRAYPHLGIAEMHHLYLGDLHRHVEIDESWIEPASGVTGGAELWQMPPGLHNFGPTNLRDLKFDPTYFSPCDAIGERSQSNEFRQEKRRAM